MNTTVEMTSCPMCGEQTPRNAMVECPTEGVCCGRCAMLCAVDVVESEAARIAHNVRALLRPEMSAQEAADAAAKMAASLADLIVFASDVQMVGNQIEAATADDEQ